MKSFWKFNKGKIFLILIIALGAFLRFYNLNWDQNTHIHPDERFLTMVGNAIKIPHNFSEYLNPSVSTLNPANAGYKFFVYGLFPLSLNKELAVIFNNDTYNTFNLQGRFISALADLIVIILIYKTVQLLEKKYRFDVFIKFYASFLYSIFVLPIQLSHFFAVDTFLNLFVFAAFYCALGYWLKKKIIYIYLAGIFFGLALASKVTAIFVLLLIIPFFIFTKRNMGTKSFLSSIQNILLFILISYFCLRISNPYIFASSNILDPKINKLFIDNLNELKALGSRDSFYPPNVQWINKVSLVFVFKNLIIFGVGVPVFVVFIMGIVNSLKDNTRLFILGILTWMSVFFIYQGIQVSVPMRYFILVYPFIAIIGAFGLHAIYRKFGKIILIIVIVLVSIWSLMFFSIYTKPYSRVTASYWILQNIPRGSLILSEAWDDALPLMGGENYQIFQLPVFDPDSQEKWQKMNDLLNKSDYLILSSNRGWASIPTVPQRYPEMSKFYKDLFSNKLSYKKIKEITSYPSISYLGIPLTFPDQWADESFTVYDHPKVFIFERK
jgi:4-amino-4-deoxy-L-arabinose transferase-like glycosyltransferase